MTLMWQTQFSQSGYIRGRSHFVPPIIIVLIAHCDCTHQLKQINPPPIQFTTFCHWIVVSFIEHYGCPSSLFVFFCSPLSGAVESNNCVSCCVIMCCSLFLLGLYWNLDPVPLQWLSPSVSEELMVSPSPCEFSPLQLNYPSFSLLLSFSTFNISSLASHISPPYLSFTTIFPPSCSLCLTPLPPPFSTRSQFSLASYPSTSIALLCLTLV